MRRNERMWVADIGRLQKLIGSHLEPLSGVSNY